MRKMIVVGKYSIKDVLDYAINPDTEQSLFRQGIRRGMPEYDKVLRHTYGVSNPKIDSWRYWLFKHKGTKCVNCGIEGDYFLLEYGPNDGPMKAHFNLYATGDNGEQILMTKDHIVPKSKGGEESLENLQVMCERCNSLKAANSEIKQVVVIIKDGKIEQCISDDPIQIVVLEDVSPKIIFPKIKSTKDEIRRFSKRKQNFNFDGCRA